jgi:hypothetical protein
MKTNWIAVIAAIVIAVLGVWTPFLFPSVYGSIVGSVLAIVAILVSLQFGRILKRFAGSDRGVGSDAVVKISRTVQEEGHGVDAAILTKIPPPDD